MWNGLKNECDSCNETATNILQHSCRDMKSSEGIMAIVLSCSGVTDCDDVSVALQKIDYYLSSVELTEKIITYIQDNIEIFPQFVTLIDEGVTCQKIVTCF